VIASHRCRLHYYRCSLIRLHFTLLTKTYDDLEVTYKQTLRESRRESAVQSGTSADDLALQFPGTPGKDSVELCSQLLKLFQAHCLVHIPEPVLSFV
jgi:hypothetical protein